MADETTDELSGKGVIVTGGSRGIGLACAEALSRAGARVLITGRNAETGQAAARSIPGEAVFAQQDVATEDGWKQVMKLARRELGRVDILVANAGISTFVPIEQMELDAFRTLCDINLKGAFLGVKYGAEALREHGEGGAIILISSVMGRMSQPANAHYSAAKSGVRLLAKAAALELGPEGIRVNAILPGLIHSDMTAVFNEQEIAPRLVPMQRFGDAREIGETVLFAASQRSAFMTGAELVVDGGLLAQ